ncbi:unnamed protein product, partial [Didymodactylos carnosus]
MTSLVLLMNNIFLVYPTVVPILYTLTDRKLDTAYQTYYYCNFCEKVNKNQCACGTNDTTTFFYSSVQRQVQQILSFRNTYTKIMDARKDVDIVYPDTKYAEILKSCPDSSATLLVNSDGIELLKGVGIWPFILVLNELPLRERFMLKNIVLPIIWPTGKLPTTKQIQASIQTLVVELVNLENGCDYYIPELGSPRKLHLFTIASCNDKPSQCKMENVKGYMAEYGCGVCYTQIRQKSMKRQPPIRVYPFEKTSVLRTNESHDENISKMKKENLNDEKGHL